MDTARIEDLKITPEKKLTNDIKNALVKIINEEFNNQRSVYDAQINSQKSKIQEAYRKSVRFDQMIGNITKAKANVEQQQRKLYAVGLNESGEFITEYGCEVRDLGEGEKAIMLNKIKEIKAQIEALNNQKPLNMMNKIVSRLWLADTYGEAIVILNQVLGNGIIPTLTLKQLEAPKQAEQK